jgi:hypothetical protein
MSKKADQKPDATRSEAELSEAIQDCGARCMDSADPKGCVEAYVIGLIASGWSVQDAKAVQRGTLRVLATIKQDNSLLPQDG